MLKYVTFACVLVAVCSAAPQEEPREVQVLRFDSDVVPDGYSFEHEEDKLDNPQSQNAADTFKGTYSYIDPDGKHHAVEFTAGPNGFQPKISLAQ